MSYESSFKKGFERSDLAEHEARHRRTDLDGRTESIDLRWAAKEAATGTARASQIRKKGEKK